MFGQSKKDMLLQYLKTVDVEELLEDVSDDLLQQVGDQIPIEKIDNREPSYTDLEDRHEDVREGLSAARYHLNRGNTDQAQEIIEDLMEALDG